ncbi:MAG: sulfotransferase [Paracoccaceae bacterium]
MITLRKRIGALPFSLANLAVGAQSTTGRPVFVVGNGRSGTSWLGETLGQAEGVLYYREPCHPHRNGINGTAADGVWCRHVPSGGRDGFFEYTLDAAFRGHFWRGAGHGLRAYRARIGQRPRIVIKDVASFLSLEWVAARWQPDVVVILRHPGAYAASVLNLQQDPQELARLRMLCATDSLRDLLGARLLDPLAAIRDPMEAAVAAWTIRTAVFAKALPRHPDWQVVSYEDLAQDPLTGFRALYDRLGLPWSDAIAARIRARTSATDAGAFSTARVSHSRIDAWRDQLSPDQARRIRQIVAPFNLPFYSASSDWD